MPVLTMDERRRITLPQDVVTDTRQQFVAIRTKDGILLKPLLKDPLKAMQAEGRKLRGISRARLRKDAEDEALRGAR